MARGKYSPCLPKKDSYEFNMYGKHPAEWSDAVASRGVSYDPKTMFGNFDDEGFDRYGYSCFDTDGGYVGLGSGVDRNGKTEMDYLLMSEKEFEDYL